MALAFVQNQSATGSAPASLAPVFGSDTTTGNFIFVTLGAGNVAQKDTYISSISDGTNTYQKLWSYQVSTSGYLETWYAKNITGGTTPTVTVNLLAGLGACGVSITEVSGAALSQPIDFFRTTIITTIGASTKYGLDTPDFKLANNFVYFACWQSSSATLGLGTGFTNLQTVAPTSSTLGTESQVVASQSAIATRITSNQTNTAMLIMVVALSDTNLPSYNQPKKFFPGIRPHPFSPGLAR